MRALAIALGGLLVANAALADAVGTFDFSAGGSAVTSDPTYLPPPGGYILGLVTTYNYLPLPPPLPGGPICCVFLPPPGIVGDGGTVNVTYNSNPPSDPPAGVPEPASGALFLSALATLIRKRRS